MMKKRLFTLFLALTVLGSLVLGALPAMATEGAITLRVHYFREDGDYDGCRLYLWDNAAVPCTNFDYPYQFEEIDGEMICEVKVNTGTSEIGYIVRWYPITGCIEASEDKFIDIEGIMAGTVDVYIKNSVEGCEIVLGDDVVKGSLILSAVYKEKNRDGSPQVIVRIAGNLDREPDLDTFTVFNSDGAVNISAVKCVQNYYYLTLAEPLNLRRGYMVAYEDKKSAVTMPDIYSSPEFEAEYTYTGDDLGATYTPEKTTLRVWAPTANSVNVNLYTNGDPEAQPAPVRSEAMTRDVNGTWICELAGDRNGTYYTYEVTTDSHEAEACDPYARATGVNGHRAMILDLDATDPSGWEGDGNPNFGINYTDAVIYELHVRDLSSDASSGIDSKGKYMGLMETDTKNKDDIPTGLDHIIDLGVTHVQLMPVFDFGGVDESKPEEERSYSWGYDPVNYNVPEGSYSFDPYNGEVRVKEFKQMVKGLHESGISVVMDVVYNHVYDAEEFCFNQLVPGYFTRPYSNASGCGNDVASERSMVSKYILDSVNYWADEYHIDGFCFDLVGILDTDTINEVVRTVREKHPDVIFYGEGWTLNTKLTKTGVTLATQINSSQTPNFAYFSDNVRTLVKGLSAPYVTQGFISGGEVSVDELNACFKGLPEWCSCPGQSINFLSAYDNSTLFDHIALAAKYNTEEEWIKMNKLGAAFYLTAQGVPFLRAGEEMLRTKPEENGSDAHDHNAPDADNSLKWDTLSDPKYMDVYEYYRGLLQFRRAHASLRLADAAAVDAAVQPVADLPEKVVAYRIQGGQDGEPSDAIFCAFNAGTTAATITLPEGEWNICVNGEKAGVTSLGCASDTVEVPAYSAMVLVQGKLDNVEIPPENLFAKYITIALGTVLLGLIAVLILKKKAKTR